MSRSLLAVRSWDSSGLAKKAGLILATDRIWEAALPVWLEELKYNPKGKGSVVLLLSKALVLVYGC